MTAEQEAISIPTMAVEPFDSEAFQNCPACGAQITLMQRFVSALKGGYSQARNPRYCPGGKAPESSTLERGMIDVLMRGDRGVQPCAGILEPHLHASCGRCSFPTLMATKTPIRRML